MTSSGSPSRSSLLYRVQVLLESAGHAGDQVDVVVHAAAHAAVHQRANGCLLGARVEEILRLVVAVHRAPGEAILRGRRKQKSLRRLLEKFGRCLFLGTGRRISHHYVQQDRNRFLHVCVQFLANDALFRKVKE